jgi:hypothetical protein
MTSLVSTLHLNTATDAISINGKVATFCIDWDTIMHGKQGKCRVYAKMRSNAQDSLGATQFRTLNASFQSNTSNNTNGVKLCNITTKPINAASFYYIGESRPNQSQTIDIPFGKQLFNVIWDSQ